LEKPGDHYNACRQKQKETVAEVEPSPDGLGKNKTIQLFPTFYTRQKWQYPTEYPDEQMIDEGRKAGYDLKI
jgi:hypothetical protein